MEDWKTRLADEYRQVKERYKKLKVYNMENVVDTSSPIRDIVDHNLRIDQQLAMEKYLHTLELRAELHGIPI